MIGVAIRYKAICNMVLTHIVASLVVSNMIYIGKHCLHNNNPQDYSFIKEYCIIPVISLQYC